MSDVFVSYKAEDRRRVKPLVEALRADGYSVWWDEQIDCGTQWRRKIEAELNAAKCVIVVWSRHSVGPEGTFVQDEATRAQHRHVYIPVTIDQVYLPLGFGETQDLVLEGWRGDRSDPRYRAVLAAVKRVTGEEHAPLSQPSRRVSRRAVIAGAAAAAAAIAGGGAYVLLKPTLSGVSDRIAVLPFANLSGDPSQSYFSDGIAEEIRSALARLVGLKVVGRTSSEAVRNDDAATAARKLRVGNILVGSVRQSPAKIRINAQLVDGRSGLERWSQTYDRSPGDAINIQTDIAENVARALSIALGNAGRAALRIGQTANAAAYDQFLKAVAFYSSSNSRSNLEQTISLLDSAIGFDPQFAEAYALRARALVRLVSSQEASSGWARGFDQAEASARKAVALAPALAAARTALATVATARLDFALALNEFGQAEATGSNDVAFLLEYGKFLTNLGSTRKSLTLARRAIDLDPLNPRAFWMEARALFTARDYHEAITSAQRMLDLSPGLTNAIGLIGDCLTLIGRTDEARTQYSKLPADDWGRLASEAILAARTGDRKASDSLLAKLQQLYGETVTYQLAQVHAQRGEARQAIDALNRALEIRDPGLAYAKGDPWLDPLRDDVRFARFLKTAGFPGR
jgi:serine/threonine-protein kinase